MLSVVSSGAYQAATAEVANALLHEPDAQRVFLRGSLLCRGNMRMVMPDSRKSSGNTGYG